MPCCLCNSTERVQWCKLCKHNFCGPCRGKYFARGAAALEEWFAKRPPKFCYHGKVE